MDRSYAWAIAAAFGAVAALGLLIQGQRFGLGSPAILEDWIYSTEPAKSPGELADLFFNPVIGRFRPGYELWSHIEWQTFGAPQALVWPNMLGAFRMLLFCAALTVVPGIVAATRRERAGAPLIAALGIASALIVFSSPGTNLDFLRLGTQEPLFVGAAVCGAALLCWATGRMVGARAGRWGATVIAGLIAGFWLWAMGIYHKEAGLALIAAAPFLYLHLNRRWREEGRIDRPLWRCRPFQLVVLGMLLPVVHVLVGSLNVSDQAVAIYGAENPTSIGGWITRLGEASEVSWDLFAVNEMLEWRSLFFVLVVMAAYVGWRRRRVPWLEIGLIVTGVALLVFQGVVLIYASRYLIPAVAMFAIAGFLLAAQLPRWAGWAATVAALALAISNFSDVTDALDDWSAWNGEDNEGTIDLVAELNPESCPVYMINLVAEQSEAIPKLMGLKDEQLSGPCRDEFEGVLVGYEIYPGGPEGMDDSMLRACADPGGPEVLRRTPGYRGPPGSEIFPPLVVLGCKRFGPGPIDGQPLEVVRSRSRLLPGVGNFEIRDRCALRFGAEGCYPQL